MFIGNQTSCWAATPGEPFDYALARHFTAFEWFPDKKPGAGWDEEDLDQDHRQSIRSAAQAAGMRLSVHGQWQANPLQPGGYPVLWKDVQLAVDLGAALLNVHLFHDNGLPAFVEAIRPLVERTAQAGLQLAIENTPQHTPEQFNELFTRLRELNASQTTHLGMCLDLGHANLSSSTRNDYLKFLDRLDAQVPIIHLHLHENWGDVDSHLPLFTGPSARDDSGIRGVIARLKKRGFSGSIILEQWPDPPALLNQARDRLQELWGAPPANAPTKLPENRAPDQPAQGPALNDQGFAERLAEGDRRSRSWREKLELVNGLLRNSNPALTADQLVEIAVYLKFLGTGTIRCSEDGRHFRPGHHARLSSEIQEQLVRFQTPDDQLVLRRIYASLPSSSARFQRPEPLTRIRDIAHRNDIGSDLKNEIKIRLQNKLHRCAGPEDLLTSSEILQRVSAPGANYPAAFVEQFRIFHEELKEFFNAGSLQDRLIALRPSLPPKVSALIDKFLRLKPGTGLAEQVDLLRTLTELRDAFVELMSGKTTQETHEIVLADISLEDFAFTVLSQVINACDNSTPDEAKKVRIESLILALTNFGFSGISPLETRALISELKAWGIMGPNPARNENLRLRASLLRCRRFAEEFGARILALFASKAEAVGRALGVAEHAYHVFAEADIRSHVIFQVSKIADGLLRQTRLELSLPPWDVIVPGTASGRGKTLNSLTDWHNGDGGRSVVFLEHAAGDEEIPKSVAAILLAHEMPHLAHLSVRARQAGVVFVACEDAAEFNHLRSLEGKVVSLKARADGFELREGLADNLNISAPSRTVPKIPEPNLSAEPPWISLDCVQVRDGGAKSFGARRLMELSREHTELFTTPWALTIPFGVMKAALEADPSSAKEYQRLLREINERGSNEFDEQLERIQNLVKGLTVPREIAAELVRRTGQGGALIARSSANSEDLETYAGAGLYESVANVLPSNVESAIKQVWASLWTKRATESRKETGISHEQAHMAVLVQEFLNPDFAFVLHTVSPIEQDHKALYAEIVIGLGETLASASLAGTPYRLTCRKPDGPAQILAFANFSQALHADPAGGLRKETLDYSQVRLSREFAAFVQMGRRLAKIGSIVERAFGGPQDIEGLVVNDKVYLVQARPQQGLAPRTES